MNIFLAIVKIMLAVWGFVAVCKLQRYVKNNESEANEEYKAYIKSRIIVISVAIILIAAISIIECLIKLYLVIA